MDEYVVSVHPALGATMSKRGGVEGVQLGAAYPYKRNAPALIETEDVPPAPRNRRERHACPHTGASFPPAENDKDDTYIDRYAGPRLGLHLRQLPPVSCWRSVYYFRIRPAQQTSRL